MSVRIGTNIASLQAQRMLGRTAEELAQSSERLASGLRINRASDDAGGLAVASSLQADSRVFTQALRNVNDGISFINVATGALGELSQVVTRLQELTEQSANGVYSTEQRHAVDSEADELVKEFNRVVSSTSFNGRNILSGDAGTLSIQAGYGANGQLSYSLMSSLKRSVGDGTFQTTSSFSIGAGVQELRTADFNNDGRTDIVTSDTSDGVLSVLLSNSDGSFSARVSFAVGGGSPWGLATGDVNKDGKIDILSYSSTDSKTYVFLGAGNGTFGAGTSYAVGQSRELELSDLNNDGTLDLVGVGNSGVVTVALGNSNGSFKANSVYNNGTGNGEGLSLIDMNNDGITDILSGDQAAGYFNIFIGNGDGTFSSRKSTFAGNTLFNTEAGDFNDDGYMDVVTSSTTGGGLNVFIGNSDGTFRAAVSLISNSNAVIVTDINEDGNADIFSGSASGVTVHLGNGDGSFSYNVIGGIGAGNLNGVAVGDFNGDGAVDIAAAQQTTNVVYVGLANAKNVTSLPTLNLNSRTYALGSMSELSDAMNRISLELGALGAFQSRLMVAQSNLSASRTNIDDAYGRIMDADVASEASENVRKQILQNIGVSILAQANLEPSLALKLLK